MANKPSPQRTSATALAQLLIENPDLPEINWTLRASGHLTGVLYTDGGDAVIDAYKRVLGGTPSRSGFTFKGTREVSHYLYVTWRDVELSVTVWSPAADAELEALSGSERDGRAAA